MIKREVNGVTYFTFEKLDKYPEVKHGFSSRLGGVSDGVFDSLNLGFNRGDLDENVKENFKRISDAMGIDYNRLCFSHQTHTTNIKIVKDKDAGNGIHKELPYQDVDGIITNTKNLPLVTFYADCVPLFMYDPVQEVIGLSHSGWRGTVGKIGKLTIEKMTEEFGSNPADIIACVGPSICADCYEVSEDVANEFKAVYKEKADSILKKSAFNPDDNSKYMLNLWEACKINFLEAGVSEANIEITDYCTRCNPKLFYSHRIMGANRGSLAGFMSL